MISSIKGQHTSLLSGILFVMLFAFTSLYLAETSWFTHLGINSLVVAIILGIFYSNTLRQSMPAEWGKGIQFSAKQLLRLAIILYGFRVTFQQIISVGLEGFLLDLLVVSFILGLGIVLGIRVLKMDRDLAILISAGSAICGAAAVLAVEEVLKSQPYKTAVAVGTVVLFGTISMFIYPFLQHAGFFGFSEHQYGVFIGASVHEVAQALVAGTNISGDAGNIAVVVKMTRVLLLVPVIFGLSFYLSRRSTSNTLKPKMTIPWFALGFVCVIGFNSLQLLPITILTAINNIDSFLLTMAMSAIGIETNLNKIKGVGIRPLYLAVILFILLMFGVRELQHIIEYAFY